MAYTGPERRNDDPPVYGGPERRAGGDRRSGAERRAGIQSGGRTDLRSMVAKARVFASAIFLSALAAVGSYAGTYRAMEFLFTPAVAVPVSAPVTPVGAGARPAPATGAVQKGAAPAEAATTQSPGR